jgi:hypothetical protein
LSLQMPLNVSPDTTTYWPVVVVPGVETPAGVVAAPVGAVACAPGEVAGAGVVTPPWPGVGVVKPATPAGLVAVAMFGRNADSVESPPGCTIRTMAMSEAIRIASSEPRYKVTEGTALAGSRQAAQKSSPWSSQ